MHSRGRSCIEPQYDGKPCEGDGSQEEDCGTDPCPSECGRKLNSYLPSTTLVLTGPKYLTARVYSLRIVVFASPRELVGVGRLGNLFTNLWWRHSHTDPRV